MAENGQRLESYTDDNYFATNPIRGDMRQADRTVSLSGVSTYIYQLLADYQGKWGVSDLSEWAIEMPFARYLSVGNPIKNITTEEYYTIHSILDERTNAIRLSGSTAPQAGDILELTEDNMVNFVSDYPQEHKEKPVNEWVDTISYRVIRVEPGSMGPHPFDPPTEIKPRIRETLPDPDHPGSHIQVLGQWFDNLIQFDCWAKTNNRADSLVEWFEDFMYKYTWVLKKNGVNEILYWMRKQDEEVRKWRNDLQSRSVVYFFRTEKIRSIREYDFKQIDIYLELADVLPSGFYGVGYNVMAASGYTEILDEGLNVS